MAAATARPQPSLLDHRAPSSMKEPKSMEYATPRGYSDSIVPHCQAILKNGYEGNDRFTPSTSDLVRTGHCSEIPINKPVSKSQHSKLRQQLQLPSFKSLGISTRRPDALLTPPDEGIIDLKPVGPPILISRSSSYPPSNMPKTPSPDITNFATRLSNELSTAEASGSTPPTTTNADPTEAPGDHGNASLSSSSGGEGADPSQAGWLVEAVELAAGNIDPHGNNVVSVLSHSQPCPLSNGATPSQSTTAFHSIISGVQNRIDGQHRYIHITHAIPVKFSMNQIPNSPATTPSIHNAGAAAPDYFSLQTNVFSNAVVAVGHSEALNMSTPSSPHPVVPPSSISVSLLERFIPPSTAEEYLHLFSTDGPSVLVDRLIELSPNNGSLIFIYPTGVGATTFAHNYLGPLLHPLLRTMCSIHNLSMDFGAGVGNIGAVEQMLSFEHMLRKLSLLLRKLSRGTSAIHRAAPKFTLVAASKQLVDLDRRTWTDWWTHQETPRMRTVVERYLKRGAMMPQRNGGKDVTAATLVQEVLDGVREGRSYADSDEPRAGVEVGVFVVKRTS